MTGMHADVIVNAEPGAPMMHSYASRRFDSPRGERAATASNPLPRERRGAQNSWAPVRRSGRVTLEFAVEVYGRGRGETIFREDARTLVVSAYGALLALAVDVELGQVIILTCKTGRNREAMHCRVVHREEAPDGTVHVGVAFMKYAPGFWGVSFPTEYNRMLAA